MAQDASLEGRWKATVAELPAYVGTVLIDAHHRAIFADDLGPTWRGYVARADSTKAEFVITNGTDVQRVFCTVQSRDLLHCVILRAGGTVSGPSPAVLTRIGQAPANLTSALH